MRTGRISSNEEPQFVEKQQGEVANESSQKTEEKGLAVLESLPKKILRNVKDLSHRVSLKIHEGMKSLNREIYRLFHSSDIELSKHKIAALKLAIVSDIAKNSPYLKRDLLELQAEGEKYPFLPEFDESRLFAKSLLGGAISLDTLDLLLDERVAKAHPKEVAREIQKLPPALFEGKTRSRFLSIAPEIFKGLTRDEKIALTNYFSTSFSAEERKKMILDLLDLQTPKLIKLLNSWDGNGEISFLKQLGQTLTIFSAGLTTDSHDFRITLNQRLNPLNALIDQKYGPFSAQFSYVDYALNQYLTRQPFNHPSNVGEHSTAIARWVALSYFDPNLALPMLAELTSPDKDGLFANDPKFVDYLQKIRLFLTSADKNYIPFFVMQTTFADARTDANFEKDVERNRYLYVSEKEGGSTAYLPNLALSEHRKIFQTNGWEQEMGSSLGGMIRGLSQVSEGFFLPAFMYGVLGPKKGDLVFHHQPQHELEGRILPTYALMEDESGDFKEVSFCLQQARRADKNGSPESAAAFFFVSAISSELSGRMLREGDEAIKALYSVHLSPFIQIPREEVLKVVGFDEAKVFGQEDSLTQLGSRIVLEKYFESLGHDDQVIKEDVQKMLFQTLKAQVQQGDVPFLERALEERMLALTWDFISEERKGELKVEIVEIQRKLLSL